MAVSEIKGIVNVPDKIVGNIVQKNFKLSGKLGSGGTLSDHITKKYTVPSSITVIQTYNYKEVSE